MNNLRTILLVLMLSLSTTTLMAVGDIHMNVYSKTSLDFKSIPLESIDKIVFPSEEEMVIYHYGKEDILAIDDIDVILFENIIDSIEESEKELSETEIKYIPQSGQLKISALAPISMVLVYNMQGVQMLVQTPNQNIASYDISAYPRGVYVIVADVEGEVKTVKIIK